MNARNIPALLICALLAACGGGGGGSPMPQQPTKTGQGVFKFTLKVPQATKQVQRKVLIGGKYVSPGTKGLGLSFSTTTLTPSQITTPNFALDLTACANTAFTTCVTNPDGSETFTLQAPVPAGTYTFEVATWDCTPTGGTTFSGNQLSNAIVPLTVTAGAAVAPPSFTLNGIPASIAFAPLPAQAHLATTSSGVYTIVGNAAQQFIFNVLDADGYIITGSGTPTLTMADATGSFALAQNVANPNLWSATALAPAVSQSSVSIALAATSPAGSGIAPINSTQTFVPQPELWISANGVTGYAMAYTFGATPSVAVGSQADHLAFATSLGITADPGGNLFIAEASNSVHLLSAPQALTPPIETGSIVNTGSGGSSVGGMTIDANDFLYVPDAHNPASFGAVLVYNNSVPSGTLASVAFGVTSQASSYTVGSGTVTGGGTALMAPLSIAIAPATASIPAALQGTVWVAGPSGVEVFKNTGTALNDLGTAVPAGTGGLQAVAVGYDGTVWVYDGKSNTLYAYAIALPASFPLTSEASFGVTSSAVQMATDPIGNVWLPETTSYVYPFSLIGCPGSCSINQGSSQIYSTNPGTGIVLTP